MLQAIKSHSIFFNFPKVKSGKLNNDRKINYHLFFLPSSFLSFQTELQYSVCENKIFLTNVNIPEYDRENLINIYKQDYMETEIFFRDILSCCFFRYRFLDVQFIHFAPDIILVIRSQSFYIDFLDFYFSVYFKILFVLD